MMASGKFVLRIPTDMHELLKKEALEKSLSLNQIVNLKLQQGQPDPYQILKKTFKQDLIGIVMFGSVVRGEAKKSSDIDLLIVLSENIKVQRSLYTTWDEKIEKILGNQYSPQFSHIPKNSPSSLWLEVALEGEILFDPSTEVRKYIYKIKNLISTGQYIRKMSYGHPYWIHQEIQK